MRDWLLVASGDWEVVLLSPGLRSRKMIATWRGCRERSYKYTLPAPASNIHQDDATHDRYIIRYNLLRSRQCDYNTRRQYGSEFHVLNSLARFFRVFTIYYKNKTHCQKFNPNTLLNISYNVTKFLSNNLQNNTSNFMQKNSLSMRYI